MIATSEKIDWEAVRRRLAQNQSPTRDYARVDERRLAVVFHERAERLAKRGRQDTTRQMGGPVLVFLLGNERFGIELAHVKQIFQRPPITSIPGSVPHLLGVANFNGSLRSVVRLCRILRLPNSPIDAGYVVFVNVGDKSFGIAVDGLDDIRPINLNNLAPLSDTTPDAGATFVRGMSEDRVLVLNAAFLAEHISQYEVAPTNANIVRVDGRRRRR